MPGDRQPLGHITRPLHRVSAHAGGQCKQLVSPFPCRTPADRAPGFRADIGQPLPRARHRTRAQIKPKAQGIQQPDFPTQIDLRPVRQVVHGIQQCQRGCVQGRVCLAFGQGHMQQGADRVQPRQRPPVSHQMRTRLHRLCGERPQVFTQPRPPCHVNLRTRLQHGHHAAGRGPAHHPGMTAMIGCQHINDCRMFTMRAHRQHHPCRPPFHQRIIAQTTRPASTARQRRIAGKGASGYRRVGV